MASNVGVSDDLPKLSSKQVAIAGASSGALTRMLCQPLDVLKIRFQLQVESTFNPKEGGHYHGVLQSVCRIIKEEGFSTLWRGHISAQCLTVLFTSSQFWCYNALTWTYSQHLANRNSLHTKKSNNALPSSVLSLCGSISAACGTAFSMPFDVARTRIVAQSNKTYSGWPDVWRKMIRNEGVFSLYRGFLPALGSSVPYAAIQFPIYTKLMTIDIWSDSGLMTKSTISGIAAGIVAKFIIYPLDVLKKRSQIRGNEELRCKFGKVVQYRNTADILVRTTWGEGILAWYKGFLPSMLKSGVMSALSFVTFEAACQLIRSQNLR